MSSPANTTFDRSSNVTAIVSLGSSLESTQGDSLQILHRALQVLQVLSASPLVTSSFYQSAPIGCPANAPDFVNAVTLLQVPEGMSAIELLGSLHGIEGDFGRQRGNQTNQARTLDLDLIAFGNQQCRRDDLVLPHPRAHLRGFVMVPLAELTPDYKLPGQERTAQQLQEQLQLDQQLRRIPA